MQTYTMLDVFKDSSPDNARSPKVRMMTMDLTRDFKDTVAARLKNEPAFAQALRDRRALCSSMTKRRLRK